MVTLNTGLYPQPTLVKPTTTTTTTQPTMAAAPVTAVTGTQDLAWLDAALAKNYKYFSTQLTSAEGRVYSANYAGSISEGQSYLLLESMQQGDKATFDKAWNWTKTNLQTRPNDNLLAWRWGDTGGGKMGVIYNEFATDADQDVAYSLLKAGQKWNDPTYTAEAKKMIGDLYNKAVFTRGDRTFILAGDWDGFTNPDHMVINPSYIAPYVYREFAKVDTEHAAGWNKLASDSYSVMNDAAALSAKGLPPNFAAVDKTGKVITTQVQGAGYSTDFGFDSFRVFWRMAEDAANGSPQAKQWLEEHQTLLTELQKNGQLPQGYSITGQPLGPSNSGYTLSAAIAQTNILDPSQSKALYDKHLAPMTEPGSGTWMTYSDYFPNSVVWLGLNTARIAAQNAGQTPTEAAPPPVAQPTAAVVPPPASVTTTPVATQTVQPPVVAEAPIAEAAPTVAATQAAVEPTPVVAPAPKTATVTLPEVSANVPIEQLLNVGIGVDAVKGILTQGVANTFADGQISSGEIQTAWHQTTHPVLLQILGKLDYFVRKFNRPITEAEFTALAGDKGFLTINDVDKLPTTLKWR